MDDRIRENAEVPVDWSDRVDAGDEVTKIDSADHRLRAEVKRYAVGIPVEPLKTVPRTNIRPGAPDEPRLHTQDKTTVSPRTGSHSSRIGTIGRGFAASR